MQMMAASHAAQMAQSIDPSVITEQRVLTQARQGLSKRVRANCALTVCSGGRFALVICFFLFYLGRKTNYYKLIRYLLFVLTEYYKMNYNVSSLNWKIMQNKELT
jgi:hypothetical protein